MDYLQEVDTLLENDIETIYENTNNVTAKDGETVIVEMPTSSKKPSISESISSSVINTKLKVSKILDSMNASRRASYDFFTMETIHSFKRV